MAQENGSVSGFWSAGRVWVAGGLLMAAGIALPQLRQTPGGPALNRLSTAVRAVASPQSISHELTGMADGAKVLSTRSRLRGFKEELRLYAHSHSALPNDLGAALGQETALDAWGRRVRYQPPSEDGPGCLFSYGPDGVRSQDDVVEPVTLKDFQ